MYKVLSIFLITFFAVSANAQNTPVTLSNYQVSANFLSPGISIETRLSSDMSLHLNTNLNPMITVSTIEHVGGPKETHTDFALIPNVEVQFRKYYKRNSVKKTLNSNSGNYLALLSGYNFESIYDNAELPVPDQNRFYAGPVWGMQRNYQNGFHLDLNLGLGFELGNNIESEARFLGGLTLGFVLK